jgi:hypothetical protein
MDGGSNFNTALIPSATISLMREIGEKSGGVGVGVIL